VGLLRPVVDHARLPLTRTIELGTRTQTIEVKLKINRSVDGLLRRRRISLYVCAVRARERFFAEVEFSFATHAPTAVAFVGAVSRLCAQFPEPGATEWLRFALAQRTHSGPRMARADSLNLIGRPNRPLPARCHWRQSKFRSQCFCFRLLAQTRCGESRY